MATTAPRKKRSRWDTTTPQTQIDDEAPTPKKQMKTAVAVVGEDDKARRAKALKERIKAQLAALKKNNNLAANPTIRTQNAVTKPKKQAKVFELNLEDSKPDLRYSNSSSKFWGRREKII